MRRVDDTVLSGCPLEPALPAIPSSSLRLHDLTNNVISPWQLCTSKPELTFKINDQTKCYLIYMAKWRNSVVWAIRIDLLTFDSLPTKHLSSLREIPQCVTNNPAQCICPHSPSGQLLDSLFIQNPMTHLWISADPPVEVCERVS